MNQILEFRGVELFSSQLYFRQWQTTEQFRRGKVPIPQIYLQPIEPANEWLQFSTDILASLIADEHVLGLSTLSGFISKYKIKQIVYDTFCTPHSITNRLI